MNETVKEKNVHKVINLIDYVTYIQIKNIFLYKLHKNV